MSYSEYLIKDIVKVNRGSSPRPIVAFLSNKGLPWLKISDFNLNDKYVYETKEYIKEDGLKNTRYVEKGTLILTNSATPGIPIFLGKDMCLHDGFLYFTNVKTDIVDINYLYYWFLFNRLKIINQANGSVFKNLKKEIVENFTIKLPNILEQKKITKVLDDICNQIDNLKKNNDTIISIIDSLYNDLVNNKKIGNKEFISEEWQNCKLKDVINIVNGFAFKGKDFIDSGVPVIKIKNIKTNKVLLDDLSFVSEQVASTNNRGYIKKNSIILTMTGNRISGSPDSWVGKAALFNINGNYMLNQRLAVIEPVLDKITNYFLIGLLTTWKAQLYFIQGSTSSGGQANISPDLVNNYDIVLPPKHVIDKYSDIVCKYYDKISINNVKINSLENLRDMLIPRLISGELNIDNIEF